jgi:hypothetical protein
MQNNGQTYSTNWNYITLFNIENLVLRARSALNGFAGAGVNRFGVLEHCSIGVLAKTKARI